MVANQVAGWCRDDALPFVLLQKNEKAVPGTEARYLDETREQNSSLWACHCIELPFLLGSQEAWRAAPALAGADWAEIESIGKRMREIWADFARGRHADTAWSTDAVRVLP